MHPPCASPVNGKGPVLHAISERITVAGPEIVGVRLTAAAYGLQWRARQDSNRADARIIRIPIQGAAISLVAAGTGLRAPSSGSRAMF
jgi:hypothetical protein